MRAWAEIPAQQAANYTACPGCGGPMALNAQLCRACRPTPSGESHYAWKGDSALANTKRERVANRPLDGVCERCAVKPGTDRHHKDGDPGNNAPSNLTLLCRSCHMIEDGRLERFMAYKPPVTPPKPCVECGKPSKPLRRGLCHACNERLRRARQRMERVYGIEYQR